MALYRSAEILLNKRKKRRELKRKPEEDDRNKAEMMKNAAMERMASKKFY